MKVKLKELYKSIDKSYPLIGSFIRRIYHFNAVKKIIHGHNNTISYKNTILSQVVFDISGNDNQIVIDEGCILHNVTFYILGDKHRIFIGKDCRFNSGGNIWFEDNNCSLVIGEKSSFEDVHLALTEPGSKITIGKDCMFAYDINIRTGDSHSILSQKNNERINYAKNISIGDHVWIAAHCILLKGSCIPKNSVVATGCVVTRCYETKGIIIGGNPSKQLKEGITWSRERIYK